MKQLTAFFAVVIVALLAIFVLEIQHGLFAPQAGEPAPVALAAAKLAPQDKMPTWREPPDPGPLLDVIERPLFNPSRRPPAIPTVAVAERPSGPDTGALLRYALIGTVITGEESIALLRSGDASGVVELHVGDDLLGWRLDEIAANAVTFSQEDEALTLEIAPAAKAPQ